MRSRWSRIRRWLQPFAPDPVPAVSIPAIPAEEWPPVEAPVPEQFEGPWANMPDLGDGAQVHVGIDLASGPDLTAVWPPVGASGLIHKFEPGRPIELEPDVFSFVVLTPQGESQRIATSGRVGVKWLGGMGEALVFWDEKTAAFNGEGYGILMAGWMPVSHAGNGTAIVEIRNP